MEFNENIRRSNRNKIISVEAVKVHSLKSSIVSHSTSNDKHEIQKPLFEENKLNVNQNFNECKDANWKPCNESENSNTQNMQYIEKNETNSINTELKIENLIDINRIQKEKADININNTDAENDTSEISNAKNHVVGLVLVEPENNGQIEKSSNRIETSEFFENKQLEVKSESFDIDAQSPSVLLDGAEECDIENLSTEAIHESESEDDQEFIPNYNTVPNIFDEQCLSYQQSNIMNSQTLNKIDENVRMVIFGNTECITTMNMNISIRDNKVKLNESKSTESKSYEEKDSKLNNDENGENVKMNVCETTLPIDIDNDISESVINIKTEIENSSENLPTLSEDQILRNGSNGEIFGNKLFSQNKIGDNQNKDESIKEEQLEQQDLQNSMKTEIECPKVVVEEKIIRSADLYISVGKNLTVHCKLCLEKFNNLKLYKKHIINKHESNKTEANDITESRLKFVSSSLNMFDYNDDSNIILNENIFEMPIGEVIWEAHLDKFKYQCSLCNNIYDEFDDLLNHENCVKMYEDIHEAITNIKPSITMEVKESIQLDKKAIVEKVYINDGGKDDERWDKLSFSEIMELINKHIGIPDVTLENDDILKVELRDDRKIPNDKSVDPNYLDDEERKSIFTCQLCGKVYTCRTILREHVRIHTGDRIFQCDICNKGFLRSKYLDSHKILFHSNPDDTDIPDASIIRDNISKDTKSFQCRYCERLLSNKSIFEDHLKVHYGVEPFRCQFCDLVFIRRRIQASHEFQIHDDKFLKCSTCNRQFDSLNNFQEHKKTHKIIKPEQFVCSYCNEEFPTKQKLTYHTKVHEAGNRFKCSECDKICGNQYMLDQHLRKHNKIKYGVIIKCSKCEMTFENFKDLRIHRQIHDLPDETDQHLFKCKHCSLSFRVAKKLSYHERLHQIENKLECEHCNKCFGNKSTLQQHLLTHKIGTSAQKIKPTNTIKSLEDELKCTYCGLKFNTPKKVRYHELRHQVGDKFECKYCAKHFTSGNALDQHCRKHLNNVQAFVCSQCPAKFSLKETRDLHETFHIKNLKLWRKRDNTAYEFECNYCVKCFATEKCLEKHVARFHMDLDMYKFKCSYENCAKRFDKDRKRGFHERLHVAGQKFKCKLCPKLCYDDNTLKQHLRRHGQESDFKCKFCPATFNLKRTKTLHEKFKHSSTIKIKYKKSFNLKFKTLSKLNHCLIYDCNICNKSFSSAIILKLHNKKNHEESKYLKYCPRISKRKFNMKLHQSTHLDKNAYKCKNCLKSFKTKVFLKLHINRKHSIAINSDVEECKLCNLLFEKNEYIKHKDTIHSNDELNPYKCLNCNKKFHSFGLLRVHRLTHINLFKCDFCIAGFRQENLLRQHLVTHRIEKNRTEKNRTEKNRTEKNRTEKKLNSNEMQTTAPKIIFTCPICQKRFSSFQWKLLAHMEKKHNQPIFRCQEKDYCRRSFLTEAELIEHKKIHLGARIENASDEQKPFKCNICDRRFIYEAFMKGHIDKFHHSSTPKCKNCHKKFDNEADFLKHKPICTQNKECKPFQCPYCVKQFSLENVLNSHLHRAHNAELYKCSYCRQNFLKSEILEEHIKNHHIDDLIIKNSNDTKPFKCEFDDCNHRFISSVFLNNHLAKIHNVTIYRCEHCKKGYREEKYLNEHKSTHIISFRTGDAPTKMLTKSTTNSVLDSLEDFSKKDVSNEENSDNDLYIENFQNVNKKENNDITNELFQSNDVPKKNIEKKSEDESQVLEELFSAVVGDLDFKEDDLEGTSILKHLLHATDENEPSTSQYVPESLLVETEKKSVSLVDSLRTYRKKPSDQSITNELIRERKQSLEGLRPFKCQECDKSYVLDIYLLNHVTKVHGADALARQTAEISNVIGTEAIDDIALEHPEQLTQFECDQCHRLFSTFNLLKVHKKLHSVKPFKCNKCPAEFASQQKYNEHADLHKLEIDGKPIFKCVNCEKLFPNNSKLKLHEKSHSIERPFRCDLCPLTFKTKAHFFDHKRSHTGEKPFQCRYCPERFPRGTYKLKHERKHPEFLDTKQKNKNKIEEIN